MLGSFHTNTWINQYSKIIRSRFRQFRSRMRRHGMLFYHRAQPARAEAIETIIQHCLKISKIPPKDRSFTEQLYLRHAEADEQLEEGAVPRMAPFSVHSCARIVGSRSSSL